MQRAPPAYDFCSPQKHVSVDLMLYISHTTDTLTCIYVINCTLFLNKGTQICLQAEIIHT